MFRRQSCEYVYTVKKKDHQNGGLFQSLKAFYLFTFETVNVVTTCGTPISGDNISLIG